MHILYILDGIPKYSGCSFSQLVIADILTVDDLIC
jgi:hypothetical protein